MAAFKFEYEALLEIRRREERDRQVVVATLERERLAVEDRLRQCQNAIRAGREEMRAALGAGPSARASLDFGAVRAQAAASFQLTVRAQRIAIQLAGATSRVESARAALLEASRRRRAIELLRERRYEAWKREQDKKEQAAIDELVVMRAGSRREEQPS